MFEQIENLPFWLKSVAIFSLSLWKSYSGPILSALSGFNFWQMLAINLSATLVTLFFVYNFRTQVLSILFKKKNKAGFDPKLRKYLILWRKYGFFGTMALSPILIGIPTGILISAHFKTTKRMLFIGMIVSSFIWMCIFYFSSKFGINIFS